VVSEFDYTGLAQTWSTPRIVTLNQGSAQIPAVVLGSGYSMDPLATGHLYVIQLDSGANAGKLLKKKEIPRIQRPAGTAGSARHSL
jgi:Tfp pilus tip-associated adhesin PilY1